MKAQWVMTTLERLVRTKEEAAALRCEGWHRDPRQKNMIGLWWIMQREARVWASFDEEAADVNPAPTADNGNAGDLTLVYEWDDEPDPKYTTTASFHE